MTIILTSFRLTFGTFFGIKGKHASSPFLRLVIELLLYANILLGGYTRQWSAIEGFFNRINGICFWSPEKGCKGTNENSFLIVRSSVREVFAWGYNFMGVTFSDF